MGIIGKMAAFTFNGCALVTGYMAALTGHFDMFTHQPKFSQVVVKLCRDPSRWIVACTTLGAKPASMGIIRLMAGFTLGGRTLQVGDGA
jgi:hypothetical protein